VILNGVAIEDTFAEAFPMTAARLVVTAETPSWAETAGRVTTGYASSVIGCDAEAGIERVLSADETPDGRPGVSLLLFAFSRDALQKAVINRVGQCVLTCPTTACYNGLPVDKARALRIGGNLRFFGDGWQISKVIGGRRYWRVPVMDGEFVGEETTPVVKAVGGGNLLLLARDTDTALAGAQAAVTAMRTLPGVIMPFPGGVVRSGSKVGSKYPALSASTNHAFCPSLATLVADSALTPDITCVMEIVIDGLTAADVGAAMKAGIDAVTARGAQAGVLRISAGNYGGKLGPFLFHLKELLA
jgi:formylmethanofuran--tetrahydromethanopterin N-formyltransferase